jgi:hypothetical protein
VDIGHAVRVSLKPRIENGAICGSNPQIDLSRSFAAMGRGQRRHGLRPVGCDKAKRVNGVTFGNNRVWRGKFLAFLFDVVLL